MAFAPDVRLDAPGMLYPGRKAVQCMKIDWTHPLTKGLKFFAVAQEGAFLRELVKGYNIDASSIDVVLEPSKHGLGIVEKGTTGTNVAIREVVVDRGVTMLVVATQFTIPSREQMLFSLYRASGGPGDEFCLIEWDWNNDTPKMVYSTQFDGQYSQAFYNARKVAIGDLSSMIITSTSENLRGFMNGGLLINDDQTLPLVTSIYDELYLYSYIWQAETADASMYALAVFDGDMRDEQMRALSIDPYQFLIPDRG